MVHEMKPDGLGRSRNLRSNVSIISRVGGNDAAKIACECEEEQEKVWWARVRCEKEVFAPGNVFGNDRRVVHYISVFAQCKIGVQLANGAIRVMETVAAAAKLQHGVETIDN